MSPEIRINGRAIGPGHPSYIIAEMSANHAQNFDTAVQIIEAAHAAGADAIKLQTYTADTITLKCSNRHFQIQQGTIWDGQVLHDLYESAHTPWDWHPELQSVAATLGIDFFSSPFDPSAVDFLQDLNVPAYKIASFEINDTGLLKKVAATGKPIIFSTGMATRPEIELTIDTLRKFGARNIAMLKCTSAYPAKAADMNLNTIDAMKKEFQIPIGLSDHSMGIEVPVAATAIGACIIEKHLTLNREIESADAKFSLEPREFSQMVDAVRKTQDALGTVQFGPTSGDLKNRDFRRSLFVVQDVSTGEKFTDDNVRSIRPGFGLEPRHLDSVLGQVATKDIERGTPLGWHHLSQIETAATTS